MPAVTGDELFAPRVIARRELYAARTDGPLTRPAYTEASLARALREGIDSAGRPLSRVMPRYDLSNAEVAALADHLRSLSAPAPGVTPREIHFATITSDRLAPEVESSLLTLMHAFFDAKNGRTRHEVRRADHTPWHKDRSYPAYRTWVLHHWRLTGPVETWRVQLEAHYAEQPVFAILSGSVREPWKPIHDFSEAHAIPALLPHTDQPAAEGYYTIYPSEGMRLRAKAIAVDLAAQSPQTIVQVYSGTGAGKTGVAAFRQAWSGAPVTDIDLDDGGGDLRRQLAELRPDTVLVWLDGIEQEALASEHERYPTERLYLVSRGLELPAPAQAPLFQANAVRTSYPYALPDEAETGFRRLRVWLEARNIAAVEPQAQADAYLALSAAGEALMHMYTYFSRDYFIEKLEHALNRSIFTGFYPELTSAPGQRFVAKGCYVVALDPGGKVADRRWIVP